MSQSKPDDIFVSGSFDGHHAFYGPCKDIASLSLKSALDSSTLHGVLFINKSELVFGHALGSGSFGTVYKGLLFHEDVAIKCFKVDNSVARVNQAICGAVQGSNVGLGEEQDDRVSVSENCLTAVIIALEREVAILKSLSFPQIVRFVGVTLDPAAIVTGYCEKGSLFDMIKYYREHPSELEEFSWQKRLKIAYQAATGMEYLHFNHSHPVMHGDLKSPNLLINEDFNCFVSDFNTSKFITADVMKASVTVNNPYWLAPEVYYKDTFSKAVDVYPFGIIMWELLTLLLPFQKGDKVIPFWTVAISVSLKDARPEIPPNDELLGGPCPLYNEYCELMKQCWSRNEDARPSYRTIVRLLKKWWHEINRREQEGGEISSTTTSLPSTPRAETSQGGVSSSNDHESDVGNVPSRESRLNYYKRETLGSAKRLHSPFKQGPKPLASSSDTTGHETTTTMEASEAPPDSEIPKKRSPASIEAQRRWGIIRNVIHLIIDQNKYTDKPLEKAAEKKTSDCSQSEKKSKQQITYALVETTDISQSQKQLDSSDSLKNMHGWGFIRETIFSDLGPTVHQTWDVLSGQNLAKLKLLNSTTIQKLDSIAYNREEKHPVGGRWQLVKESFFGTNSNIERSVPKSWQKLLESIYPFCTSELKALHDSRTKEGDVKETPEVKDQQNTESENSAALTPVMNMIHKGRHVMEKHWDFLVDFMTESIGEIAPSDNETLDKGRWRRLTKMMIVDGKGPTADKWGFFRDWILSADVTNDWKEIIEFAKEKEEPPQGQQWQTFRALFFENRKIRNHPSWGFLKDLFLVDGEI
eukprot:g7757.t1